MPSIATQGQAHSLNIEGRRPDGLGRLCISECCKRRLLMSPAIGAIGRILVHETLAILATDLRDLLLRHLTLWRHPVSRHGLTISRTPVGWVGIVSRIVSGRAITLWHRITWGHVALHRLWHATRWSKCNLCLARQIRPAFD